MPIARVDISPFRSALASLDEVMAMSVDSDLVRDAAIQRFEYTYELAWKMIQRHLQWTGRTDMHLVSRSELFKLAAKHALLNDPLGWENYHDARNLSSHTYARPTAIKVYDIAKSFAVDARQLLDNLTMIHG